MTDSTSEAGLRARIAANDRWARTADRSAATQPARDGLAARFEREVDPEGKLDPAERAIRAASARRAHFQRLALLSARSRRKAAVMRSLRRDSQAAREIAGELRRAADELESEASAGQALAASLDAGS